MQEEIQEKKCGRPKWLPTADDIKAIEDHASQGLNQEQIAAMLGICYDTLNERKNEFPEISEAIKKGAHKADAKVVNSLFLNATVNNNVTAQIIWMKCRVGWMEKAQIITEQNVKVESPSLEQIKRRIEETLNDRKA